MELNYFHTIREFHGKCFSCRLIIKIVYKYYISRKRFTSRHASRLHKYTDNKNKIKKLILRKIVSHRDTRLICLNKNRIYIIKVEQKMVFRGNVSRRDTGLTCANI